MLSELLYDDEHAVLGTWGHLIINHAGQVRSRYLDDEIPAGDPLRREIDTIDLDEWRKHWNRPVDRELHFEDVSYWYTDPDTAQPVYQHASQEWRAESGMFIKHVLEDGESSKR